MKFIIGIVAFLVCAVAAEARTAMPDGGGMPCRRIVTPGDGPGVGTTCKCVTTYTPSEEVDKRGVCVRETWEGISRCVDSIVGAPCAGGPSEISVDGCEE